MYRAAGELFDVSGDKDETKVEAGYCTIETFTAQRDERDFLLFRLTHIYYSQTWETEVIYLVGKNQKSVIIHINCSGDTTRLMMHPY